MKKITFLFILSISSVFSQNYTEYHTGSTTDITTNHQPGVCLMGGASEHEEAMRWFLNKADGGDVVVLRASGSNGYNNFFYSQLGVTINSVTTFVIHNAAGATDPYVLERVANAEAVWFAGGDQYDYVSYFKDNALEDALNEFINTKQGVIGGTSAGMAILGSSYFSAQYGTLTSAVALGNPYHPRVALGHDDFLDIPYMQNVITDSHYDDPDRSGRHSVFLARFATDNGQRSYGIACNEYTAVCVEPDGKAYVYGEYPAYDEFAFFLQANCVDDYQPETCVAGTPLTWNNSGEAIKVYKVPGTDEGSNYFDLSDWETGSGGEWQNWFVNNGTLTKTAGVNPECGSLSVDEYNALTVKVYPNPVTSLLNIEVESLIEHINITNVLGQTVMVQDNLVNKTINVSSLKAGVYFLNISSNNQNQVIRFIKN